MPQCPSENSPALYRLSSTPTPIWHQARLIESQVAAQLWGTSACQVSELYPIDFREQTLSEANTSHDGAQLASGTDRLLSHQMLGQRITRPRTVLDPPWSAQSSRAC